MFCPQAPALVPEVGRGLDGELGEVRAACRAAVASASAVNGSVAIIAAGAAPRAFAPNARGTFAGFGVDRTVGTGDATGPVELPTALCVGAWLTGGAGRAYAVTPGAPPDLPGDTAALVVVGDGSARRTEKAPGYLDPRADGYDAEVVAALESGDPQRLAALDVALGAELLCAGAPAWSAVAGLLDGRYTAGIGYTGAPFGVGYFVATWTAGRP